MPGHGGSYRTRWSLGRDGNMVAGRGWSKADASRVVRYRANTFDPGTNGYLSLYGWSLEPLVEYYIVDDYGAFVPPGPWSGVAGNVGQRRWNLQHLPSAKGERSIDRGSGDLLPILERENHSPACRTEAHHHVRPSHRGMAPGWPEAGQPPIPDRCNGGVRKPRKLRRQRYPEVGGSSKAACCTNVRF